MTKVAVIAHAGKSFGDGLPELRRELARQGVDDPLWIEVPKSRFVVEAGEARAQRRLRAALRLGWRRDGAAVCRRARRHRDTARDPAGRHGQPARDEPRHPAGHRARGRDRAAWRAAQARRRTVRGRALRRHGRDRVRRGDDPAGRRHAQGSVRAGRLHLDRLQEPAREAVQGEDQGRRRPLVRRRRELHPRRQCRSSLRRHRGVRGRKPRRRSTRRRRRQRGRRRRLDPHARPHGGGASGALAARAGDEGDEDHGEAEPQGPVRGRRRRSRRDQGLQDPRAAGRDHDLRRHGRHRGRWQST